MRRLLYSSSMLLTRRRSSEASPRGVNASGVVRHRPKIHDASLNWNGVEQFGQDIG
jgi:hypothetical protein